MWSTRRRRKRRRAFGFIGRLAVLVLTEQGKVTSMAQLMQARHMFSSGSPILSEQSTVASSGPTGNIEPIYRKISVPEVA